MNAKLEGIRRDVEKLREEHNAKFDQLNSRVTVLKKIIKRLERSPVRKVKEYKKAKEKGKNVPPGNRGGRPRTSTQDREKRSASETKSLKPEIVCWKRERQWIPAVEIPEELLTYSGLAVLQNEQPLKQDESRESCWCLKEAYGQVIVQWNEDMVAKKIDIAVSYKSYLLFKLSGQDQNQGRRVKSPSSGSYLVIVPDNLERDCELSGPPPVTPESVSLTGYQAHFFELEKDGDGKIAFCNPTGEPLVVESKASRFELVGNRINDASEDKGPLFGKSPPKVHTLDDQAWKDIRTIVIGEEGIVEGRWRESFAPTAEGTIQDLPSEVMARKGGWYFLRFYDTNDDLIESLDFRFISALGEIRMHQPPPLAASNGHKPALVEFLHEPGCSVQLVDYLTNIQIECQDNKTTLTIPPDPTCDETHYLVGSKGKTRIIEVTILVERLWWAIGEENFEPSKWVDRPLTLGREDFAATSKKALWIRLPRRRWVDKVPVGFEQPKVRLYDVKVTEKTIAVPFREFGDTKVVGDRTQEHSLRVWIERDEGVVAIVPVEQPPRVDKELPNFVTIPTPRFATVLTRLRRATVGPLRMLIKEVRQMYFRGRPAIQAESVEFKRYTLCMIALSLELNPQIPGLKSRWAARAQLIRDEFPEIMNRLRNRLKEISTSRTYRVGIEGKQNESNRTSS